VVLTTVPMLICEGSSIKGAIRWFKRYRINMGRSLQRILPPPATIEHASKGRRAGILLMALGKDCCCTGT